MQNTFQFINLFLPFEYGRDSRGAKVKFVFSEKVPLFEVSSLNPFRNLASEQATFANDEAIVQGMLQFFEKKPLWRGKIKGPENLYHHVTKGNEAAAAVVDKMVEENLVKSSDRMQTFGRRCHHAKDLVIDAANALNAPNPGTDAQKRKIVDVVNEGKRAGMVYSFGDTDIFRLRESTAGLEPFICF